MPSSQLRILDAYRLLLIAHVLPEEVASEGVAVVEEDLATEHVHELRERSRFKMIRGNRPGPQSSLPACR